MKKLFIVFIFILSFHVINAQNRITGKITDQDNFPLPGAAIFISEINKGTYSDEKGEYPVIKFAKRENQNSVFIFGIC